MSGRIEITTAVQAIRSAFQPLTCAVEFYDRDKRIRFRVWDHNQAPVVDVTNVLARRAQNPLQLSYIIDKARAATKRKGFELDAWAMPS